MSELTDQIARDKANEAAHALKNHIMVTGIKLDQLDQKFDSLVNILKWAGGLIVMLFISTLTWSLAQQYNANEATKKDLQTQVELMRQQQENSRFARQQREEMLNRLPASGTETTVPTRSDR